MNHTFTCDSNADVSGEESTGVVRTAPPANGGRHSWPEWLRKEHTLEGAPTGSGQDWSNGQAVRDEPQGHAPHTGEMLLPDLCGFIKFE